MRLSALGSLEINDRVVVEQRGAAPQFPSGVAHPFLRAGGALIPFRLLPASRGHATGRRSAMRLISARRWRQQVSVDRSLA